VDNCTLLSFVVRVVSQEDFGRIAAVVRQIVAEKQPFERLMVPKKDALEMFKVRVLSAYDETYSILQPKRKTLLFEDCGL
jgi:threonyl-tRNA synthetase